MRVPALPPRLRATATAAAIAGAALLQLHRGADAVPSPLVELESFLFGHAPEIAARVVVALECALAASILVAGTRFMAAAGAVLSAFVALACVSRGLRLGGVAEPGAMLAASIALVLVATAPLPAPRASTPRRHGLSPAWRAFAAIVAGTVAARTTASLPFGFSVADLLVPNDHARNDHAGHDHASETPRTISIDLDLKPFEGRPLRDTPLLGYMPDLERSLEALAPGQAAYLVFYNPSCETCHTVFDTYFRIPRAEAVLAIEIPLADGAISAASEPPRPVDCPTCELLSLPAGPAWLIAPPMVVRVRDGLIECVADRLGGDCLTVLEIGEE